MVEVTYSTVIDAGPDDVWEIVRDFGGLARWFPFIERSELEDGGAPSQVGVVRANTVADSGNVIREQLLELSDVDRRVVYAVVGGEVPMTDYTAVLTVHRVVEGERSFVEWTARYEPVGDAATVAEWVRSGIFATCLAELGRIVRTGASHAA